MVIFTRSLMPTTSVSTVPHYEVMGPDEIEAGDIIEVLDNDEHEGVLYRVEAVDGPPSQIVQDVTPHTRTLYHFKVSGPNGRRDLDLWNHETIRRHHRAKN